MSFTDNLKKRLNRTDIGNRPSVVLTIRIDNPRFTEINLDSSGSIPKIEGVFSIDVTNTGILSTRATRITQAEINVIKDNASFTLGEISKPQHIRSIPGGETRTINIEFSREDSFVKNIIEEMCNTKEVKADMLFTISEVLLAATYENRKKIVVENSECRTISIDITGQTEVNKDQSYEWSIITEGGDNIGDVQWGMGDGTIESGESVLHTYSETGQYTIEVETSEGYTASKTITVTIVPVGIVGPVDLEVGEEYTWTATGEDVNTDAELTWSTGDGSTYTGREINHTYTDNGDFTMQLASETGGSGEIDVEVSYPDITIDNISTANTVQTNQDSQFSVTGNNLSAADEIQWDMGDGTILNGQQVTHRYATSGEYTINVDAIIDEESIQSASTDITVETFAL